MRVWQANCIIIMPKNALHFECYQSFILGNSHSTFQIVLRIIHVNAYVYMYATCNTIPFTVIRFAERSVVR